MTLTARRIRKRQLRRGTGLETLVDWAAGASWVVGLLVALGAGSLFFRLGLLVPILVFLGACLQWLLLRCLAEHLRLQKKIAGCDYEGSISGPRSEDIWGCSNCGHMLHSDTRCESCGAQILADEHGSQNS